MRPTPTSYAASVVCIAIAVLLSGCGLPKPVIAPRPGTYHCPQTVRITNPNSFANIYYTLDGSTPTTQSLRYDEPITVANTETVRTIAANDGKQSGVVDSTFSCSNSALTRAEFAALLQQQFSLPQPNRPAIFPDLPPSAAMYSAVQAAAPFMNGQVMCPGCQLNTNFFGNDPVTRVTVTVALVRILVARNSLRLLSREESERVLASFPDGHSLPLAGRVYFASAISSGIMSIPPGQAINPRAVYTSQEMPAMLARIRKQFNSGTFNSR